MDLTLKKNVKNLLNSYRINISKRLGQNFLIDKTTIKKVIKTADLQPTDIVLEIGPGIGTLTKEIAKKVKKVIAVEKDPGIYKVLKETLKDFKNIKIIQGDILKIKDLRLKIKDYKIVANLPFYLTSPFIRKFLESEYPPKEIILIIQKEVAQRICARPPKTNLLAVSIQFYAKPKIISHISKKSFWPSPKVDSAIIKIIPHKNKFDVKLRERFSKIVKAGFSQSRKQLANNLSKRLKLNKEQVKTWLLKNNIQPHQRAETLNINGWIKLTEDFIY